MTERAYKLEVKDIDGTYHYIPGVKDIAYFRHYLWVKTIVGSEICFPYRNIIYANYDEMSDADISSLS